MLFSHYSTYAGRQCVTQGLWRTKFSTSNFKNKLLRASFFHDVVSIPFFIIQFADLTTKSLRTSFELICISYVTHWCIISMIKKQIFECNLMKMKQFLTICWYKNNRRSEIILFRRQTITSCSIYLCLRVS